MLWAFKITGTSQGACGPLGKDCGCPGLHTSPMRLWGPAGA